MTETIYALSSPPGNGVAIIRLSGSKSLETLEKCFSRKGEYAANMLYYGKVIDKENDEIIDECMAVYFAAPHSYTGEESAEIQCHGSMGVITEIMALLQRIGLRQAEPGEFSRRAFENGRIDLSQAEAVMELIHSDAGSSAKAALSQLSGSLGDRIDKMQENLLDLISWIEAFIDYPDEESDYATARVDDITKVMEEISELIGSAAVGRILKDGYKIAIIGKPNAGKSTLLNRLIGYDRAIVTNIAGTTRDLIEEKFSIQGIPMQIVDTAGLRESAGVVEQIGIELAKKTAEEADVILYLFDASTANAKEIETELDQFAGKEIIAIANKVDVSEFRGERVELSISAMNGDGIKELEEAIISRFRKSAPLIPDVTITNARHKALLVSANKCLERAESAFGTGLIDIVALELRAAWQDLGEITGKNAKEDIIDRIFSKFCLGK